jgi:hypothetical protein
MQKVIGRESEISLLKEALESDQAELIAVYGRRRVGKTFLILSLFEKEMLFELTGLKDTNLNGQLINFCETLATQFKLKVVPAVPKNWISAFRMLINLLEEEKNRTKTRRVIFLDEFPWLDTPRSGFLSAFDHFWNSWASRQSWLTVIICGSAASWMIQNIVRNKGGLHNRLTRRIRLMPFNLHETELFLRRQKVILDRYSILQLYMALGGIPHYLKEIRPGDSTIQAIDRLFFTKDGLLRHEFEDLYLALFDNAALHLCIIRALAAKPSGLSRNEIMATCKLSSGGALSKLLDELMESGFIMEYVPFKRTTKDAIFKLGDEFTLFYLKFVESSKALGKGTWSAKAQGSSWQSWAGLAFETICLKHIQQIKKALSIAGMYVEPSIWRYQPKNRDEKGAQIDLLLDRQDNVVNLVEIKFSQATFSIDKDYAEKLRLKRQVFMEKSGSSKSIFTTMLTTKGLTSNVYSLELVQNALEMGVLFEPEE